MSLFQADELRIITRLIASRILFSIGTFLLVSILIFVIIEVLPGDAASRIIGRSGTAEMREQMRERLGLNDPAIVRYGRWLGNALQGDLGNSLAGDRPVVEIVWPRLKNSLILSAAAIGMYLPLSFGLGILTAMFHNRHTDNIISIVVLLGMSVPEFVIGTLLIVIFTAFLGWLPAISLITTQDSFWLGMKKLVLPSLTLTAAMTAYGLRMLREGLIEIFESEFVRMATLRGLPRWRIIFRHALPSSILPMLNVTAINIAWLVGGVVVVEVVFTYPGLGRLLVNSIGDLDLPLVEAIVLIMAFVYVFVNLLVDIAAIVIDPRLRTK